MPTTQPRGVAVNTLTTYLRIKRGEGTHIHGAHTPYKEPSCDWVASDNHQDVETTNVCLYIQAIINFIHVYNYI